MCPPIGTAPSRSSRSTRTSRPTSRPRPSTPTSSSRRWAEEPLMSVTVDVVGAAKTFGDGPGAVHAFGPLDLTVVGGSFVALLGPSGCGKSTLLLMIAGLLAGSAGEIRVARRPVAGPQTDIGIVFQSHALVD